MSLRLHWFQHVPFEGLGSIADWCRARGATVTRTRFFAGDPTPGLDGHDVLVVMGGPMSVNDGLRYPWLEDEKRHIAAAIAAARPVLGICLGAQLIAAALGAAVYPNPHKEIGWLPITREASAAGPLSDILPPEVLAFHWHGETFDLPAGAVHLARSRACANQAFALGDRVVGLQCHLETTRVSAAALVAHCAADMTAGPFVQSAAQIMADDRRFDAIHRDMTRVLDRIALAGAV